MQFGIMAMQIGALIPPDLAPEKLLTHIQGFSHANLVRGLVAQGFNLIELNGDLGIFLPQTFAPDAIEELAQLKEALGVRYTMHLPLWSVEPSTPQTPVREGSVRALIHTIQATEILMPEIFVLHATGALAAEFYRMNLPELAKNLILHQFQNYAKESVKTILSETGIPSRKLAIETIGFPFERTLELADELDTSICLDTGHILVGFSGPIGLFEALESCLPRLAEVHLHDGPWQGPEGKIGFGKDHQPLGAGDLEVARFFDRLIEVGFEGPIIFELTVEGAQISLDVIRSLRPNVI